MGVEESKIMHKVLLFTTLRKKNLNDKSFKKCRKSFKKCRIRH